MMKMISSWREWVHVVPAVVGCCLTLSAEEIKLFSLEWDPGKTETAMADLLPGQNGHHTRVGQSRKDK